MQFARKKRMQMGCHHWWNFWHRPRLELVSGTLKTCESHDTFLDELPLVRTTGRVRCHCGHVQKFGVIVPRDCVLSDHG